MNELAPSEQFTHLAEEVQAIIAQKKFEAGMSLLEMRHEIGRAILESPLYEKNKRGQGKLIADLAARLQLGERTLRYAVEFAEKYPKFETALQSSDPGHKLPSWRDIVRNELPSGKRERPEERPKCRHCPLHCPDA